MLEFETGKNKYVWDEQTSLFLPYTNTMHVVKEMLDNNINLTEKTILDVLSNSFEKENIIFCYNWLKKWEKINTTEPIYISYENISEVQIKHHILSRGLKSLTLNVTDECNFRCTYCVFSGEYEHRRNHSNSYMKFSLAQKAIDYYFSLIEEGRKYNPLRTSVLAFYGGEPLLNFELIKKCVEYITEKYDSDIKYSMTTNGSLLNHSIIKWLIKHEFNLIISLDGSEKEHNRNRVYKNGSGTFKDVMKNINLIMKLGYEISVIPTYDIKSDFFEMEKFFANNMPKIAFVAPVDNSSTNSYYDQFNEEDYKNYFNHLKKAEECYLQNIEYFDARDSVFTHLFGDPTRRDLCDSNSLLQKNKMIKYTATCFPGYKLFVSTNGTLYLCEKVSNHFPIGNINNGLDYNKMIQLMKMYFDHMDHCPKCLIQDRCSYCFKHFEDPYRFKFSSEVCKDIESEKIKTLTTSLKIGEIYPQIGDKRSKFKDIKNYYGD